MTALAPSLGTVRLVDLRLAVPVAVAWAASAVLVGLPAVQRPAALALWLAAGIVTAFALRWRVLAVVALSLVLAAGCATSVALQQGGRSPEVLAAAAESGERVTATLVATGIVVPDARSWEAEVREVAGVAVRVPVIVFGGTPPERVEIGSVLEVEATLEATESGDDRSFVLFPDDAAEVTGIPTGPLAVAASLRAGFLAAASTLPGPGGQLLPGLAIGETTEVPDALDDAMTTSSLSHLTAVSGANCAIVIGLVMLAGRALGLPRALRVGMSLPVLVAFVLLVTPEPSVLRAATMAAIVLVLLASGRPVRGLPVLALAVLALLIVDPWLSRTYGFTLSVLATAGLLILASPLAERLSLWMPRAIAFVIAIPVAAQVACQPAIVLLDPTLPTYGIVANVLAAPAAPIATVVGLAACLALPIVPAVGSALCSIAWVPAAWIAGVANFFSALPGARLPWLEGLAGVAMLAGTTALVLMLALGRPRLRQRSAVILALAALCYVGVTGTLYIKTLTGRPADWQVAVCDIGQGDAILLRSEGRVALVDTGPDPEPLGECLDELGVGRLDLLVLTHFDHDHVGGAAEILGRADRVLVGPSGSAEDDALVARIAASGATVEHARRGDSGMLGAWRWSVLWPARKGSEVGNGASVVTNFEPVLACRSGCLSMLLLGDLGEESQRRLLDLGVPTPPDVVSVAHHGSADQYPELYERLGATVGTIGVGADNGYGHPTSEALSMLDAAGTRTLRTDRSGLILLAPGEGGAVRVWQEKAPGTDAGRG